MTCSSCGGPADNCILPHCAWCFQALPTTFLTALSTGRVEVTTFGDSAARYLDAFFCTHSAAFTNSTGPR